MNNVITLAYCLVVLAFSTISCKPWESEQDSEDTSFSSERELIGRKLIDELFSKRGSPCTTSGYVYSTSCSGTGSGACGKKYKFGCTHSGEGNCYCDNTCTVPSCPVPTTNSCVGTGSKCYPNGGGGYMGTCCSGRGGSSVCCGVTNLNSVCCSPGFLCCRPFLGLSATCKQKC